MSTKSATLSYLKQNIRDSRLSDWTFQPIPHQALLDKLSQEILDFEKWVNQTNEKEDKLIAELLGKLKQNINEIYSNAEVINSFKPSVINHALISTCSALFLVHMRTVCTSLGTTLTSLSNCPRIYKLLCF